MAGRRAVYWDACIFIAWLKGEERPNKADLDGITYLVEQWDAGSLAIVTSTITRIEVLDSMLSAEQAAKFALMLRRSTVSVVGVTTPIADLAHTLRDFYASPRLSTPDAIHLATAIAARCETFFTFDGTDASNKKTLPLLSVGPTLAGKYALTTLPPRRPPKSQGSLLDLITDQEKKK